MTQSKQGIKQTGIASIELGRQLDVTRTTAWKITVSISLRRLCSERDAGKRLTGHVKIDDAYLGGERTGGKRERGTPGKTPFVTVVETTQDGKPARLRCAESPAFVAMRSRVRQELDPTWAVVNDGLQCFASVTDAGCSHQIIGTGSGPQAARAGHLL